MFIRFCFNYYRHFGLFCFSLQFFLFLLLVSVPLFLGSSPCFYSSCIFFFASSQAQGDGERRQHGAAVVHLDGGWKLTVVSGTAKHGLCGGVASREEWRRVWEGRCSRWFGLHGQELSFSLVFHFFLFFLPVVCEWFWVFCYFAGLGTLWIGVGLWICDGRL